MLHPTLRLVERTRTCLWPLRPVFVLSWNKGKQQARKYRTGRNIFASGFADQDERSPLIRMGIAHAQLQHGFPQSLRFGLPLLQEAVKRSHVFRCALVM